MNKKGYITVSLVVVTILTTTLLFGLIAMLVNDTTQNTVVIDETTKDYISQRNAYERLYSELKINPSLDGLVEYKDIDKIFNINELSIEYRNVELTGNNLEFVIRNKTDLNIDINLTGSIENPTSVSVVGGGTLENLVNLSFTDIDGNRTFNKKVTSNQFYSNNRDNLNYGLSKIYTTNNNASLVVNRNIIEKRVVEVKTQDDVVRSFEIKVNTNGKVNINAIDR